MKYYNSDLIKQENMGNMCGGAKDLEKQVNDSSSAPKKPDLVS